MSYYILPRIETQISIMPSLFCSKDTIKPYISHSLVKYMKESHIILEQQLSLDGNKSISISMLHQVIHTYDFLFSVVSGFDNSISKINTNFPIYYDITEIYYTLKIYEGLPEIPINILCFGKASSSVSDALKFHRSKYKDHYMIFDKIKSSSNLLGYLSGKVEDPTYGLNIPENVKNKCHIIYFEASEKDYENMNKYIFYLIKNILCIYNYQSFYGYSIIKIDKIVYKPIIDVIYIISGMFDKCYIMKPNTSNVINDERYLICKNYKGIKKDTYSSLLNVYNELEKNKDNIIVDSLLSNKIFSYFTNKIEESNIIIGQQKLDAYAQIINLLKSKNKMGKIDILQKHNIQKCMYWCDKYKIPYNKLFEFNQICFPSIENTTNEEYAESSTDDLFFTYMNTHYSDCNDSYDEYEESSSDVLNHQKIDNYRKKIKI